MQNGRRYPSPERRISDPRQAIKGKWFPISWPNHLLRVYAGRGHGKRSSRYLFPLQGAGPGAVISESVFSKEPGARRRRAKLWWGEAPEEPSDSRGLHRTNAQEMMGKAGRRAEPWPTIDHGSAGLKA